MPATIEAPSGAVTDVPAVVESPKENLSAVETFDRDLKGFQQLFKEQRDKDKAKAQEEKPKDEKADKPDEVKDKKPEPEKPKKEPAKKEEPKPAAEEPKPVEEEEEERPRPRRRGKERDIEEVAASAASKAAAETAAKMADRKPKEEPDLELPKDVKYKLKVFDELEAANPEYKGTSAKYRKWLKEVDDHQRKWQSEHPNEDYDPEADEHDSIYRKEPTVSEEDYDQARVSLAQKKGGNAEVKKLQEEQQTLKQKLVERELEPKIYNESVRVLSKVLGSIDEAYGKTLEDPKGLEKLNEEDPIATSVLANSTQAALPFVREVVRLYDSDGQIGFDKDNAVHQEIVDFARRMEQTVLARPPSKQMLNGREYLPMTEYANLTPSDRKHYWSFSDRDILINHRISLAIHDAQELLKHEEAKGKAYEKRFSKKGQTVATPAQDKKVEPEKPADDIDESPSPSGAGRSTVDTFGTSKTKEPENFNDIMLRRLHGG